MARDARPEDAPSRRAAAARPGRRAAAMPALIRSFSDDELLEAEGGRDIVCLALTFHGLAPGGAPPWALWLQSLAYFRLGCRAQDGALCCALRQFETGTAGCPGEERALIAALAAAWGDWTRPLVVTLQGKSALLPLLRLRSLIRDVAVPPLHPPALARRSTGPRPRLRADHLDLIDELELPRGGRPALPVAALCDDLGMPFTETFEEWRHDAAAAAQIMALATLLLFIRRSAHDGTLAGDEGRRLTKALLARTDAMRDEAPWLDRLARAFGPPPEPGRPAPAR